MCESCVAPILILIITMFYKKDEQVRSTYIDAHALRTAGPVSELLIHRLREYLGST